MNINLVYQPYFSKFRTEGAAKKSNKSPLPKNTHILASSALKALLFFPEKDKSFIIGTNDSFTFN